MPLAISASLSGDSSPLLPSTSSPTLKDKLPP